MSRNDPYGISDREYKNLMALWREEGYAEGVYRTKERMGNILDQMAEQAQLHKYCMPYWPPRPAMVTLDAEEPVSRCLPMRVEFDHDQLRAIRVLLCGLG